jgi:hypothetical protein
MSNDPNQSSIHEGWEKLPDEHLPRPTYFPAGLAMGTTLVFWSLITSWVILVVGMGLVAASLAGWISEILHEHK